MTTATSWPNFETIALEWRAGKSGVAQVSMNRPSVFNAFDEQMIQELQQAFILLGQDPKVRVIVLKGEGKHFSAGADLKWMQRASSASPEWNLQDARRFAAMLYVLQSCPKPTVARIQGAALGGGVGLACACDFAYAAVDATFSVSEAKFGILPAVIGPYVTNAVGKRQAKRLALTATRVGATEALSIGLIHGISELAELDTAIDQTVAELLHCGPQAQTEIKRLFSKLSVAEVTPEVLELTAQTISRVRGTDEAKAGFEAFLNKQPAPWIES
ncbi:enoyl-CoA hydratase-related protein [Hydrogenophaga sp. OTU3427]|uniref:enoyl-CoA hydratase-related protein n=1 Tax=Hydrogenophaga sp. OTU3427 TaxID=3043856 RepID=UPI00313C8060